MYVCNGWQAVANTAVAKAQFERAAKANRVGLGDTFLNQQRFANDATACFRERTTISWTFDRLTTDILTCLK